VERAQLGIIRGNVYWHLEKKVLPGTASPLERSSKLLLTMLWEEEVERDHLGITRGNVYWHLTKKALDM